MTMHDAAQYSLPGALTIALGLYAYLLPFLLYASWSSLAFWDLDRRNLGARTLLLWSLAIFAIPLLGAAAYHIWGRPAIPANFRWALLGGGTAVYLIVLLLGAAIGGIA